MPAARTPTSDEVSLGEIVRRLDDFRASTEEWQVKTDSRFDGLNSKFVAKDLYEERHTNLSGRVTALEAKFTRITVTLGGFILTTIGGVIAALVSRAH